MGKFLLNLNSERPQEEFTDPVSHNSILMDACMRAKLQDQFATQTFEVTPLHPTRVRMRFVA